MFKRFIIYFFIILLFILLNNVLYANNEENEKIIKEVINKTGFNIEDIYCIKEIKKIKIHVSVLSRGYGCLPQNQYPSEEKRKQIYNTPTVYIDLQLLSGLAIRTQFIHFSDEKDANLGFYEIFGMDENYSVNKTLFSGETIENMALFTAKKWFSVQSSTALFIYKNCVLRIVVSRSPLKLLKEDFDTVDNFIKVFKIIVDKSIK